MRSELPDLQRNALHGAGGKARGRDRQIVYAHRHEGKGVKALLIGLGVTDLPRGVVFQRHFAPGVSPRRWDR